jgi:MFS-type transporter involved in bile tolerance (Atg22 family)
LKKLKKELKQEAKIFVPNIKVEVLESVGIKEKKKKSYTRILVPVLAVFLLFLTIPLFLNEVNAKETLVTLNINPAFLIKVEEDKVTGVEALNEDAVLVLYDEELNDDLVKRIRL